MKETEDWEQRYRQGDTGWDRGDSSDNLAYWLQQAGLKPCRVRVPAVC